MTFDRQDLRRKAIASVPYDAVLMVGDFSNHMDEWDWDCTLESLEEDFVLDETYICLGSNLDWRGNSGYCVRDIDKIDDLVSLIAAVSRTAWTMNIYKDAHEDGIFYAWVAHHDVPMGGGRKFMTLKRYFEYYIVKDMTIQQLQKFLSIVSEDAREEALNVCGVERNQLTKSDFVDILVEFIVSEWFSLGTLIDYIQNPEPPKPSKKVEALIELANALGNDSHIEPGKE